MADSEELRTKLGETFGADLIKNNTVDRKALGALVFKNKVSLKVPIFYFVSFRID